jgi:hypothetical protein
LEEYSLVDIASSKPQLVEHNLEELLVPATTRLLQPVEGFDKATDLAREVGSGIARGLSHVNFLVRSEFAIEICTFDINLMYFPVMASSFSKGDADGGEFGNGCKCVKVVNTWDVGKAEVFTLPHLFRSDCLDS